MNYDLFHRDGPGRFYRGNLHTHSNQSDGGLPPEEVIALYRRQGYDFLSITDHFMAEFDYPVVDTTHFRSESFTTLIGAELHAPSLTNRQEWHIVACGLPLDFEPPMAGETGPELAQRAANAGAFIGLAHPQWYGATPEDLRSITSAHAVEIYNEVCSRLSDRAESWYHADHLLAGGLRINAYAADDAHFFRSDDLNAADSGERLPAGFQAWVWVRANSLDPDRILAALKAGDFYSSQGPLIRDIALDEAANTVTITCSPATSIFVTGAPDRFADTSLHRTQLTSATFQIEAYRGSYIRVTVVDSSGKRAWSNPIWLG